MKKAIVLAFLGVSAVVCLAQSSRFPPINLYAGDPTGNACTGNTIQQSSTTGLIYTCQSGTMKAGGGGTGTITAVNSSTGLTGGGSSGSVSLAVDGTAVPFLSGASNVFTGTLAAKTLGGGRYASQWQTGGGNNGIANAAAANQVVIADPTYGLTERLSPATLPAASNMHFIDLRQGQEIEVFHNPTTAPTFNYNRFGNAAWSAKQTDCYYDTIAPAWTFTNNSVTVGCTFMVNEYNAPGWTYGEPAVVSNGANGWVSIGTLAISNTVRTKGIFETLAMTSHKYGTGDNAPAYIYGYGSGGSVSPADESNKALAIHMDEDTDQFIALCSTGCTTGSTSVLTNAANRAQGPGRLIFDSTKGASATGHFTAVAAGLGGASAVTVDATVPVSTAWGSIAAIATPVTPTPPFTSSQTFNVTVASGTFAVGGFVCFSGNFHEQSIISAVTNGAGPTASVTVPLRGPHAAGTYIFQGGMCGNGFEVAALTYNSLKYLFDVVGSTTANTLQVVKFAYGTGGTAPIPSFLYLTFPVTTATNSVGQTVYGNSAGASNFTANQFTGHTITITGMSDSALNANCTNLLWTSSSSFQCTIAGLTGTHTTASNGTATFLNANSFNTYPVAEVTDVQNETLTPPQVDGTLALEPNNIQFATNDSIVETHYPSSAWQAATASTAPQNPYTVSTFGASFGLSGKGAQGGGTSQTSNAAVNIAVGDSPSSYTDSGGLLTPPNGISLNGSFLYGINTNYASNNGALININATTAGNTHRNHQYSIWNNLFRIGGAFFAKAYPYYGDVDLFNTGRTLSIFGNPLNINSGLNFLQVYDQIRFMATGTPGTPTVTCSPTGGALADGTYYYKTAIVTNVATSLPSAEVSGTVTGGSGNGSCAIDAVAKVGATFYRFYGRTTGAEQQISFTTGVTSTYFVDTGTATPSGAPVVTDTTLGWIDQAAKLCVNSSTTAFETCLAAPSGASSGFTLTLPQANATLATTAQLPTTMVASGASHAGGLVPDPGSSAGTTRYLREDATWVTPSGGGANTANIPAWLKNLGDSGSNTDSACPSGTCVNFGDLNVRNFTVSAGATVTVTAASGITVHATGTCQIDGTIDARGVTTAGIGAGFGVAGSGGGGGGGTGAGTAGSNVTYGPIAASQIYGAATAGTAGGGNGGNGTTQSHVYNNSIYHIAVDGYMAGYDGQFITGSKGGAGGSSGGAGGNAGTGVTLICGNITGSGTIDVSGQYGGIAVGANTGAGGGGGGGSIFLSSQAATTFTINTYAAGGAGSLAGTVGYPEAVWSSGTATSPAKALLGVTTGALNGTCTVQQAGAGYGTGTGTTVYILGGGGTQGTAVVNATWSGGALASCTVTPGTSSGYTATTYAGSGAGGDGGNGFIYTVSGW